MPALNGNTETGVPAEASASRHDPARQLLFDSLVQLQESTLQPSFRVDYWQQNAIHTVMRHLSFAMVHPALPVAYESAPFQLQYLALLDTLISLLTQEKKPPDIVCQTVFRDSPAAEVLSTSALIRQVQGIRAGPLRLS